MKEEPLTTTDLSLTTVASTSLDTERDRKLTLSEVGKHITEVIEKQCMMGR